MDTVSAFENGRIYVPSGSKNAGYLPWMPHASFEGVSLKHLIVGAETNNEFSYHLVRIEPNKSIGLHHHETQLETHEVVQGSGICITSGEKFSYEPGIVMVLPALQDHQVEASGEGLFLLAKFMPALC